VVEVVPRHPPKALERAAAKTVRQSGGRVDQINVGAGQQVGNSAESGNVEARRACIFRRRGHL